MNIIGISCYYHDSAACLIKDGKLVAAVEEERFTKKKHDNSFPKNSINYCLKEGRITIKDVDKVVFYDKPLLKFDRILQTCIEKYPTSFWTFWEAVPQWMTKKLRVPSTLKTKVNYDGDVLFVKHHQSHAASAFLVSPFKKAAIVTVDGVGEWTTTAIHHGKNNKIESLKEIQFPHSLGLLYSTITSYLGFRVNNDEFKIMGLASYGDSEKYYDDFKNIIDVKEDGSFKLNMRYFSYTHKKNMFTPELEKKLGPRRFHGDEIKKRHKDIAAALQRITGETMLKITNHAHELTGSKNLCLAGGVALNSVSNGKILVEGKFENIFIQPASSDAGGSLGAAYYVYNHLYNNPREYQMNDVYLGPSFSNEFIKKFLQDNDINYEELDDKKITKKTAKLISKNNVIGWFQGRLEFGPRALGNRSILANPSDPIMKDILNNKVKHREPFRPFAPSILIDDIDDYLIKAHESPYMVLVFKVKENKINNIVSATHIDSTCRPQTVDKKTNPRYYNLIKEFKKITGIPVIINTSFNVRGQPIVRTPENAFNTFVKTDIDYLILENYLIDKNNY